MSSKKVIIIGAGHNGLICASILAEHGFDVTVVEKREKIGGLTDTYEIGGIKLSRASYVLGLMPKFLINKFRIPTISLDPVEVIYYKNKIVIPLWKDESKRLRAMIDIGEERYPELERKIFEFKKLLYEKFTFVSKPPSEDIVFEEASKFGLEDFITKTTYQFLKEHISEELIDYFVYPSLLDSPAYVMAYIFSLDWLLVSGGMGKIAERIYEYAKNKGVKFLLNHAAIDFKFKESKIKQVITDKRTLDADIVVSAMSPLSLFKILNYNIITLKNARWKKYNFVLKEYPRFPLNLKPYSYSLITTSVGEIVFPSLMDQQRDGIVLEFMGNLKELYKIFPDLEEKIIFVDELDASKAIETYGIPFGYLDHLPMKHPFLFDNRPSKDFNYTTPIENLYQCSVGTYPGGQVSGVQGYNVANLIVSKYKKLDQF